MALDRRSRLSLLSRMIVSLGFITAVAITIALVAAAATGIAVVGAITVVFFLVRTYVLFFVDGGAIESVWHLWLSNLGTIAVVIGMVSLPMVYLEPVRREIRDFNEEVGTTGTLATERHPKIATMVRRLSQQAGIAEPDVRIVNRRRPESYALDGRSRSGGTIVITRGVVRTLTDDEIEAVLAHEVSHLSNGDGRIMNHLLVPMLVAERVGSADRPTFRIHHGLGVFSYALRLGAWALLTAVTSVQLFLCHLAVALLSREREFAADRGSAELTGSPAALASALETLHDARSQPTQDMRDFKRSAGVLDILPPEEHQRFNGFLDTHPETDRRVRYLKSMVAEGQT